MRFIFTFLLFLVSYLVSNAQTAGANFELGAIGGFGLSNVLKIDENDNNGLRLGMHLGGYAQFQIQDKFGFRPELHILSIKGTSSGGYKSYYFDMPLMGTYDLDDKFQIMAGIQPSILIYARTNNDGELTNLIRTIDLGLLAGLWYKIDDQWGAGIRATRGISRVGADGKNRDFNVNYQLSIGYRFM